MLEGAFNLKLSKALRSHAALAEAVVIKHCQQFAAGVPDFSISIGARTIWIECKIAPKEPTKLQAYYLRRLRDGAATVIARTDGKFAVLYAVGQSWLYPFDELVEAIVRLVVNE